MPALIVGTIPVWVMLLGKPHGLRWAALLPGLLLTAAGLALMAQAPHAGAAHGRGLWLAVLAMACWTAFALLNAAWLRRHPEVGATDWANWLGVATGLGGLALALGGGTPLPVLAAQPGWPMFAALVLAIGFGSSWLATILWNVASQRLSASLCGQLIVSETLFALLYSFMWDHRWPSTAQWAAAALFTAGILASIKAHR
jgi:drug/metabolite transporter (DMT)-like permease